jgi:hypothetical protein
MVSITIPRSNDPRRVSQEGTILVAHQVECMPWLGNISKATMGDVYFLFDNAQYVKKHWQNKNRIRVKSPEGFQWLTIPVVEVNKHFLPTNEVRMLNDLWKGKHLKAIELSYKKAPYFKEIFPEIIDIYASEDELLVEFLLKFIRYAFRKFQITIPVYRTSELISKGIFIGGQKSDLVTSMCRAAGADTFVFGCDGRTYIEKEVFYKNNISFIFQDFHHPVYEQIHGEFIPYMSFIDLLFNHGPESVKILGKSYYLEE